MAGGEFVGGARRNRLGRGARALGARPERGTERAVRDVGGCTAVTCGERLAVAAPLGCQRLGTAQTLLLELVDERGIGALIAVSRQTSRGGWTSCRARLARVGARL